MIKLPLKYQFRFPGRIYFVTIFLILLLVAVFLVYEFHRQLTITAKQQFIGLASANLISTDQTLEELKSNLTLAQTNYQNYSQGFENQEANYNVLIEDGQKNLAHIDSIKSDIKFQNNLINKAEAPEEYETLKSDFSIYYERIGSILASLENNIKIELDILKILNTTNPNKNITLTALWQEGTEEEIINFYQQLLTEVDLSINKINQIEGLDKNNKYYQLNTNYLKLVRLTASEIVSTLSSESKIVQGSETIDKNELAFQIAVDAQAEMGKITSQLTKEGTMLYSLEHNKSNLQSLFTSQESLESKVKDIYQKLYIESSDTIIPDF